MKESQVEEQAVKELMWGARELFQTCLQNLDGHSSGVRLRIHVELGGEPYPLNQLNGLPVRLHERVDRMGLLAEAVLRVVLGEGYV